MPQPLVLRAISADRLERDRRVLDLFLHKQSQTGALSVEEEEALQRILDLLNAWADMRKPNSNQLILPLT